MKRMSAGALGVLVSISLLSAVPVPAAAAVACARTVKADVLAFDQPLMWNRLGAQNINGMMYALRRDVVDKTSLAPCGASCSPGNVALRPDKRPRPIVLRVAAGDCLQVKLTNLLTPAANPNKNILLNFLGQIFNLVIDDQVADRHVGFHVQGMQLVNGTADDSSFVGGNTSSLVAQGQDATYTLLAEKEGAFLVTSHGATFGSDGSAGNSTNGLFGQVDVMPAGAKIYRSDVTEEELRLATVGTYGDTGLPIINYEAIYPNDCATTTTGTDGVWCREGKAGLPVLNMIQDNQIVHSEINAVVAGPNADGTFPPSTYPLESVGKRNPTVPNRLEPFRDFASVFHDEVATSQAFPGFFGDPVLKHTLHGVGDVFMINYGSAAVGPEIIANRLGVGPMHDCLDCAYEEFFLTSYAVGDPATLVDVPANLGLETIGPGQTPPATAVGRKANRVLFPGDVSNVHHSYIGDFTKFRNTHTGKEHHIFHLHNHQWLFNASDDNANYLDAQAIGPGSGYTYEINFGGSGNRNKSTGDAIFHCHLYPHFAQGMWYLWRHHDVLETGTKLAVSGTGFHTVPWALQDGTPAAAATRQEPIVDALGQPVLDAGGQPTFRTVVTARVRALPDGEVVVGSPISALVPLPGKPLPPLPGRVTVVPKVVTNPTTGETKTVGSVAKVDRSDTNPAIMSAFNPTGLKHPGFPFFLAGIEDAVGQRTTTPPLDMKNASRSLTDPKGVNGWDGGLPRHALDGVAAGGEFESTVSRTSFDKKILSAKPLWYPEDGTDLERQAMAWHGKKFHATIQQRTLTPDPANPEHVAWMDGVSAGFRAAGHGAPGTPGAPYHDPCTDDDGNQLRANVLGKFFSSDPLNPLSIRGSSPFNADNPRVYKGANFQYDAVINKLGYHYPQQRIIGLWEDVWPTITKARPGEPLVMRNNTFDCTMYNHTNLVPKRFELDDYEVETPTDIIGQHIHLPKWDLTTTDGSANGWNYEDGTLAAEAVVERIEAINGFQDAQAAQCPPGTGNAACVAEVTRGNPPNSLGTNAGQKLAALDHPYFKQFGRADWKGARTTLQRWFFDPVVNVDGVDRGLGIIFTHDHFGPSTHQQIGLYATVLVEPAGSQWFHNESGVKLYDTVARKDGGPTSWQAAIKTGLETGYDGNTRYGKDIDGDGRDDSYREFYFEYSDFQHAYLPGVYVGAKQDGTPGGTATAPTTQTFRSAIKPSTKILVANPFPDLTEFAPTCIGGAPRPCPEAISADDPGTFVVNYRQEPIALRIFDPNKPGPDAAGNDCQNPANRTGCGAQADGQAGDLAFALQSRTDRKIAAMNVQPTPGAAGARTSPADTPGLLEPTKFPPNINFGGVGPGDPFTPMARGYFGDRMRVKVQAGGDEETHTATIHGVKWLQGGSGFGFSPNSGWRNSQQAGISEQFTFAAPVAPSLRDGLQADYLYSTDAQQDAWWAGMWGIIRTYNQARSDLHKLPNTTVPFAVLNRLLYIDGSCPLGATIRSYDITAVLANDVLGNNLDGNGLRAAIPTTGPVATGHMGGTLNPNGGTLVYNPRPTAMAQQTIPLDTGGSVTIGGHSGPLHDPTAMMWVRTSDLDASGKLKPLAPIEPIVLRAAAGECVRVTLRNKLPPLAPDLAGYRQTQLLVPRNLMNPNVFDPAKGQVAFDYNLFRPSSHVGLHPQLVEFDIQSSNGVLVGNNPPFDVPGTLTRGALVPPGGVKTVTWYAGHNGLVSTSIPGLFNYKSTPVEYGAVGLSPADVMKQGTKGLIGSLVVEPAGATWVEDVITSALDPKGAIDRQNNLGNRRSSRASATVNTSIRSLAAVWHKGTNMYYQDGTPVGGVFGEGPVSEDTYEGGTYGINYGSEPLWFRFGVPPETPLTPLVPGGTSLASIGNAHEAFSNGLAGVGGDPVTPVFTAPAGKEVRMHTTMPSANGRGSVFTLHGHVWQRAPYVCPGSAKDGITGRCKPSGFYPTLSGAGGPFEVGSRAIGNNLQSNYLGGQDQLLPMSHFDFVLPSAGGANGVKGDYLFHDRAGVGNLNGPWGILRVQ